MSIKDYIHTHFNASSSTDDVVPLSSLKPTQLEIGMREVEDRQLHFVKLAKKPGKMEEYLQKNPILVVRGPQDKIYVVDHHHLALALMRDGYETAPIKVLHDFSNKTREQFWQDMQKLKLVYPYDEDGVERPLTDLPSKLTDMKDDVYRSIAWVVCKNGGFDKVETPFAEFSWALYFRQHITPQEAEKSFDNACEKALDLAQQPAARNLPGYIPAKQARHASLRHH